MHRTSRSNSSKGWYPDIQPFASGQVEVGGGHTIYYEQSGNSSGRPALFLHGGPGLGCGPHTRRFFDPKVYRIVTFDQRGCGRSKPNAADDWEAALVGQDPLNLVGDCELLRQHLGIGRWFVVLGGSYGSTLALLYRRLHPGSTCHLVLRGVFLQTQREIDALFQNGKESTHPRAWSDFCSYIQKTSCSWEDTESRDLLRAYYSRLVGPDHKARVEAATAFVKYELYLSKRLPDAVHIEKLLDNPRFTVPFALLETHFLLNEHKHMDVAALAVEGTGQRLSERETVSIVHGECDSVCNPATALDLARVLAPGVPCSRFVRCEIVRGAGHSDTEPGIISALVRMTDTLAYQ